MNTLKQTIMVLALASCLAFLPTKSAYAIDELSFSEVYDKPFYKKSWFVPTALVTATVAATVVSIYTAGTGAPAAGLGVSAVASWIGGGGAGSYMAGLSTLGGTFGSNAMLGVAILNGASAATITGVGETVVSTAMGDKDISQDDFATHINIPMPISWDNDYLEEQAEQFKRYEEEHNITKLQQFYSGFNNFPTENASLEELLFYAIVAYKSANYQRFNAMLLAMVGNYGGQEYCKNPLCSYYFYLMAINTLKQMPTLDTSDTSWLEKAISVLKKMLGLDTTPPSPIKEAEQQALDWLELAISAEPEALEPVNLYMYLNVHWGYGLPDNWQAQIDKINLNNHDSPYNLATLYTNIGLAFLEKRTMLMRLRFTRKRMMRPARLGKVP